MTITIDIGSPAPSNNPPTWVQWSWQLLQNFWTTAKHSGTSINNSNVSNVYHTNSTNRNQIEIAKTKTNVFSNGLLFLPEKSMIHRLKLSCYLLRTSRNVAQPWKAWLIKNCCSSALRPSNIFHRTSGTCAFAKTNRKSKDTGFLPFPKSEVIDSW